MVVVGCVAKSAINSSIHYSDVIDELLKHGIQPFVTLNHFDLPQALEDEGGWTKRSTVEAFAAYAKTLFTAYGDRVTHWLTINEPNIMLLGKTRLAICYLQYFQESLLPHQEIALGSNRPNRIKQGS